MLPERMGEVLGAAIFAGISVLVTGMALVAVGPESEPVHALHHTERGVTGDPVGVADLPGPDQGLLTVWGNGIRVLIINLDVDRLSSETRDNAWLIDGARAWVAFSGRSTHLGCSVDYHQGLDRMMDVCSRAQWDPYDAGSFIAGPRDLDDL